VAVGSSSRNSTCEGVTELKRGEVGLSEDSAGDQPSGRYFH
jgi:hypothetical protein